MSTKPGQLHRHRNSYDNALAETINGLYKAEVIHRRGPWRSFEAVEFATLEWVDWFNNRRLLEPIGFIPPAEAEERYFAMLNDTAMAASFKQNGLRQSRSGSHPALQRADMLSPSEIRAAIKIAERENGSLSADEISVAVTRMLGFKRTGAELRAAVLNAMQREPSLR